MDDSNGMTIDLCKWCGHVARLPRNDYCSIECFHDAHTPEILEQTYRYDQSCLLAALRSMSAAVEELDRAIHGDRLDGEDAHKALRETASMIKQDAALIATRIEALSKEITDLGHRS